VVKDLNRSDSTRPGTRSLDYVAFAICLGLAAVLAGYYFYFVIPFIRIRADILMFAESDFVGDIIKMRTGAPIFTPPEDSNSLVYTPLSHVLTYAIAWAAGKATSIPMYRAIQVGFAGVAAMIGVLCSRRLFGMRWPGREFPFSKTFGVLSFLALFLTATAPRVNPYAHMLHADALALVVTAFTFWNLLCYLENPRPWRLILLAACPSIGFLTKQFLLIWAPLICVGLFLDSPRNFRRVITFAFLAAGIYGLTVGLCYLLWGDPFWFWIFEVVGGQRSRIVLSPSAYSISLVRSMNHLMIAWGEIAIGVFGTWLLVRNDTNTRMRAVAAVWVLLIAGETLTSGAGFYVLYHFGPGVLVGMMLLLGAVPGYWPNGQDAAQAADGWVSRGIRSGFVVAAALTVAMALRVVPTGDRAGSRTVPARRPAADLNRYISDIEREFDGVPVDSVLLDIGNWIYIKHSYLAKDRAISMGDQPPIGIYRNIDKFAERIRQGRYAKIMVRNFRSKFFLYEWHDWPRPAGVRDALQRYYQEVRVIPGVVDDEVPVAFTGPVSVFERNTQR
jgi:hypothetical protein